MEKIKNTTSILNHTNTIGARIRKTFAPISSELKEIEEQVAQQAQEFDPAVKDYIEYICSLSGKRIRPALALLAGSATGKKHVDHKKLGLVLELIHIASLVHDDIMDGADQRRSKKTANAKWGNTITVLLGDALFAHALMVSSEFDNSEISKEIAYASREVCMGEIIQTQRRFDMNLSIEDYFKIVEMKTGALFRAATELAGVLNGVSNKEKQYLRTYGEKLGTAYQIYDDCLDLVGSSEEAGKTLRTDLTTGKLTLPILNLIKNADERQRHKLNQILVEKEPLDIETLANIADYQGAVLEAVDVAQDMVKEAKKAILMIDQPTNPDSHQSLVQITDYLDQLLERCRL